MNPRRLTLLTEGHLDCLRAKTAVGMLRYCPSNVSCVLDSTRAGQDLISLVGVGQDIQIVATVRDALALNPTGLLLGIAPAGGKLPASWRAIILEFITSGLDVVSGLHQFLADDSEFREAATRHNARLVDLRRPPDIRVVAGGRALQHAGLRVLTIGTDECLGKMTAALEVTAEAVARGWNAKFIATGQTGIVIEGTGTAIDAVASDFLAGSVETMVLAEPERELLVIEGQGSISSPAFSGVALGLLHGCMPQALVLCHDPTRTHIRGTTFPLPSAQATIAIYESLAHMLFPCRTVAACLNTSYFSQQEARRVLDETELALGVPTTDPVRFGAKRVVDALVPMRHI
jgi:uncharacterized NAD-dependent epimerase/dehydratase family protein